MPRLVPQIVQVIAKKGLRPGVYSGPLADWKRPRRNGSLWRPFVRKPDLRPNGRSQSILLDQFSPLLSPKQYEFHKSIPPRVLLEHNMREKLDSQDELREMTIAEKQLWSSPYLRMLASPVRECRLTKRYIPSDFLIRLIGVRHRDPNSRSVKGIAVPDGIDHTKFKHRLRGQAVYVPCWKECVESTIKPGSSRRIAAHLSTHALLCEQIGFLLRQRIFQELVLLTERLQHTPRSQAFTPVIRKLTRSEWNEIKSTGIISIKGAIAVIAVPPLNKDPVTGKRPQAVSGTPSEDQIASMLISQIQVDPSSSQSLRPPVPISTMHRLSDPSSSHNNFTLCDQRHLPHQHIPWYNAAPLFPIPEQRADLRDKLSRILQNEIIVESRRKNVGRKIPTNYDVGTSQLDTEERKRSKLSHGYAILSSPETLNRGDTVPLAIALWRLRMWEGGGWNSVEKEERWERHFFSPSPS